jgi:hypothetical protein
VGNFPQAFSHVSLINSAFRLSGSDSLVLSDDGPPLLADHTMSMPEAQRMKRLGRLALRRQAGRRR